MILAIDASTTGCSVALFHEEKVCVSLVSRLDRTSAENLTLLMKEAVRLAGIEFKDLEAIAVAKGPGSYTGLRIAVSTAKGLAYSLDLPLISFSTLQAMAYQPFYGTAMDWVCPMIDARRMEVFCGFYDVNTKEETQPVEAVLVNQNSFSEILDQYKVLFLGEGAAKCKQVIQHPNANFANEVIYPSAERACDIVSIKWKNKEFEDLITFEPFYLKEYMFKK